jgi:bifunctional non-homologous end joining protein LigD
MAARDQALRLSRDCSPGKTAYRQHDANVFLYAFDLIELDGDDMRRKPLAVRKSTLASLLARAAPGLRFNEHFD